jgi:hypothetical protein
LLYVFRLGEGEENTGITIKGNALAVLDLDGLD